jgi:two-component system nitrogen regulation response regulator GlnG/two-component system response regulator HydG
VSGGETTAPLAPRPGAAAARAERVTPALVILWSRAEPGRAGELALLEPGSELLLGRGEARPEDPCARLRFGAQRPGAFTPTGPLGGARLSRAQLLIRADDEAIAVERIGKRDLFLDGSPVDRGVARPGDTLLVDDELLLLVASRPGLLPPLRDAASWAHFPFGAPDRHGLVGESPAAWALRERLAFHAARDEHALLLGPSGVGKELAARAIHAASRRGGRALVARNAATLPAGIADAELFGSARNYPNAGMPERPGVIGEAEGSTLFLDEIGELSHEVQAHLLRVLDRGGDYQRLGDATTRRADLRLIAATNRPEGALKADLVGRLKLHVEIPGLAERREDIPLLARQLLRAAAARDPELARRFFASGHAEGEPRLAPDLVDRLTRADYTLHVRELESFLWCSMAESEGDTLTLSAGVRARLSLPVPAAPPEALTAEKIQAALDRHGGSQERAYRDLGLKNRDVLYRLIKKLGLKPSPR